MEMDCAIIGGGPAGLMAALYLARFHRKVALIENGTSRARLIPTSHNFPCFPSGLSGLDLIARLKSQVARYPVEMIEDTILEIQKNEDSTFTLSGNKGGIEAKNVLLATGMSDIAPPPHVFGLPLDELIQKGLLRHCPICDGYELTNQKVAVIGHDSHGAREALFLKSYTSQITLFTLGRDLKISSEEHQELEKAKINLVTRPLERVELGHTLQKQKGLKDLKVKIHMQDQNIQFYDGLYLALGAKIHSQLAVKLGARHDSSGNLIVNEHQSTSIPGLYAAGDIVEGAKQIVIAFGQAATAAIKIHRHLGA